MCERRRVRTKKCLTKICVYEKLLDENMHRRNIGETKKCANEKLRDEKKYKRKNGETKKCVYENTCARKNARTKI